MRAGAARGASARRSPRWTTRTCGSARRWRPGWWRARPASSSTPRTGSSATCSAGSRRACGSSGGCVSFDGPGRLTTLLDAPHRRGARARDTARVRRNIACIVKSGSRTEVGPDRLPMPKDRMRRVNEAVREVLSMAITNDLKDPRVGFVTVTAVDTSPDLRHAHVYVSVLGDEQQREDSLAGLPSSHGYLQARVGSRAADEAHAAARVPLRRQRRARACASPSCCARSRHGAG